MIPGHERNTSQGQQLIVERGESGDEESGEITTTLASPSHPMSSLPAQPPSVTSSIPTLQTNPDAGQYCKDPKLRDNLRVVIGSVLLTIVGTVLLIIGAVAIVVPNETGLRGWVFLFAGFLFFVPGIYHVVYILCTVCGRPGYSFNNLPTFNKFLLIAGSESWHRPRYISKHLLQAGFCTTTWMDVALSTIQSDSVCKLV